jgi:hypothetical protein
MYTVHRSRQQQLYEFFRPGELPHPSEPLAQKGKSSRSNPAMSCCGAQYSWLDASKVVIKRVVDTSCHAA